MDLALWWPTVKPGSYYTYASGGLGWNAPAAAGIALAQQYADTGRPVVAVIGDGAMQYSVQCLAAAAARTKQALQAAFSQALRTDGPTVIAVPIQHQLRPLVPPVGTRDDVEIIDPLARCAPAAHRSFPTFLPSYLPTWSYLARSTA